jgi:hypothetical protein
MKIDTVIADDDAGLKITSMLTRLYLTLLIIIGSPEVLGDPYHNA